MKKLFTTFATLIALIGSSFAGPLDGVWINTDAATGSIPKVEITGNQLVWWGKTHPRDSKYGPMPLTLLGDSVGDGSPDKYGYVTEDVKFANHVMIMKRVGEHLVIETLMVFKDGSKRANTLETLTFKKQP